MIWDEDAKAWIFPVVTVEDLAIYLGVDLELDPADETRLKGCLDAALDYVKDVTKTCSPLRPVPASIWSKVVVEVAGEWSRRNNQGTSQMGSYPDGSIFPVRGAKDPLTYAFPILRRYLPGGFA